MHEGAKGVEHVVVSLELRQARDRPHDEVRLGEPQLGADLRARDGGIGEPLDLDTRVDGDVLLRAADPRREGLVPHRVRHADDAVTPAGGEPFRRDVQGVAPPRLVRVEREPVDRVDDARHAFRPRGMAAQDTGLGRVRVHDVRLPVADEPPQIASAPAVGPRRELAHEVRRLDRLDAAVPPHPLQERPLRPVDRPVHERDRVPVGRLALAREHRVLLRSAKNQARRDVHDAAHRATSHT